MVPRRRIAKKLLVASLGVAAVSYVVACEKQPVGNLAPPPDVTAQPPGNLMAPPPPLPVDAAAAPQPSLEPPVGNLMPPPPPPPVDAGKPVPDAGKAAPKKKP